MTDRFEIEPRLKAVLAGDLAALELLLNGIRPFLHFLVRRRLGTNPGHGIDNSDLVQEVLLKVDKGLNGDEPDFRGKFKGKTPAEFMQWLKTVTRNHISDTIARWNTKNPDRRLDLPGSKFFSAFADKPAVKQRISLDQMLVDLPTALDRLPPRRREVLEARFFENCTWPEMTRKFGKSENTLRVVLLRAIDQLYQDQDLQRAVESSA